MTVPKYKDEGYQLHVNILTTFNIAVQVILKAVDPKLKSKFCDRHIFLTKDNPKIFIGRSTKRDARLAAGAKNGWFDSAVMSRNHAKIVYLPANNSVALVDVGSLHGTYINDKSINKMQFRRLHQNDRIRFGIPIQKGPKERPVVFKVPDSSDGEDETSDIDEAIETSVSLLQKAGMTLDGPQGIGAIDLTGEEHTDLPDADPEVTMEVPEVSTPEGKEPDELQNRQPSVRWSVEAEELEGNEDTFSQESDSSSDFESHDEDSAESIAAGEEVGNSDWDEKDSWKCSDALHVDASPPIPEADGRGNLIEVLGDATSHLQTSSGRESDTLPPLVITQTAQPGDVHLPSLFDAIPSSSYQSPHLGQNISTESLGAKSGKAEYFEAREHNRRVCFGPEENKENGFPTSFQQLDIAMESSTPYPKHGNVLTTGLLESCTRDSATSALLASGEKFLRTPVDELVEMPPKEDYLDDTSAYTYELSKRGAELVEDVQPPETVNFATGGRKDKPVSDSSPEYSESAPRTVQRSSKRKSDAISELLPNETEPSSSQTIAEPSMRPTEFALNSATQPPDVPRVESSSMDSADQRPAKRFRRVAEAVGYAALGGIAVMSALIATAPSL
ncbi:hypothetical protein E5D57_004736 [Metarhizium anisopliae]|nr:hypothetical protein E5D57_004736 [Metarhizium anisopliae]